jgi:hypothetical protein
MFGSNKRNEIGLDNQNEISLKEKINLGNITNDVLKKFKIKGKQIKKIVSGGSHTLILIEGLKIKKIKKLKIINKIN